MKRKPSRLYPGERVRVNGQYEATVVNQIGEVVRLRPDGGGEETHDGYDYTIIRRLDHVGGRASWWTKLASTGYSDEKFLNAIFAATFKEKDRKRAAVEWMKRNGHKDEHVSFAKKLGIDNLSLMEEACATKSATS